MTSKQDVIKLLIREKADRGESYEAFARRLDMGTGTLYKTLTEPERVPTPATIEQIYRYYHENERFDICETVLGYINLGHIAPQNVRLAQTGEAERSQILREALTGYIEAVGAIGEANLSLGLEESALYHFLRGGSVSTQTLQSLANEKTLQADILMYVIGGEIK